MTKDQEILINFAKLVGFNDYDLAPNVYLCDAELLEKFTKLATKAAIEKEREECAFLCDELWRKGGWDHNAGFAAQCIRKKGTHK